MAEGKAAPAETWETVEEASGLPWRPTVIGEAITGVLSNRREVVDEERGETWTSHTITLDNGDIVRPPAGYKVTQGLLACNVGDVVRITYLGEVPMGPGKNPMRDYRIQRKATS